MNIITVSIIILTLSIGLAIRSLVQLSKTEEVKQVAEELKKGKVIFHHDSLSEESSEESS